MRKFINSSAKRFLAISLTIFSFSIASSSSSLSKETNIVQASRADMILYRQIFTNYFCLARQSEIKFDEAFPIAAKNITAVIINKHEGLLEELDGKQITNNQLLNASTNLILESAIFTCPNYVPDKIKKDFEKIVEEQTKAFKKNNKDK